MTNTKKLGLAVVLSLIAVACAAPAIPDSGAADDVEEESDDPVVSPKKPKKPSGSTTNKNETNPTPTNPTTPPTTPPVTPPVTPPPAGGSCAATANGDACFQCCDQASGGDLGKADEVYFGCACQGQCATACGSNMCNGGQPSAACNACTQQKCEPAADAACTSAACKAGLQCLATDCANKP